jgi:hypothetical protein
MTDSSVERAKLGTIGPLIGRGGQGSVYRMPDLRLPDCDRPLVYKEYFTGHRPPFGLSTLAEVRSRMTSTDRNRLDDMSVWPIRVVLDGNEACGVLVPLIPDSFFCDLTSPTGRQSRTTCAAQFLFVDPARAVRLGLPKTTFADRIRICRDMAGALALLHRVDLVFGDISSRNALYRLDRAPTVLLVDCDAIRFRGSAPVVRQLNTPDWDAPEESLTIYSDRYKLGLFILRVLGPGPLASVSRDPTRVATVLDETGMRMLVTALDAEPRGRPSADAWEGFFRHWMGTGRMPARASRLEAETATHDRINSRGWIRNRATGEWEPA